MLKFLIDQFKLCCRVILIQNDHFSPKPSLLSKDQATKQTEDIITKWVNQTTLSDDGWTPLHLACKDSNDIFEYLVGLGANTLAKNKNGVSLMHKAAFDDNTYLITYLRDEAGQSIHDTDFDGNTPLHYACSNGAEWASFWLLGFGHDVNALNKNLDSPMHLLLKNE